MTTREMKEILEDALSDLLDRDDDLAESFESVTDYEAAGLLTNDEGLVVRFTDGSEFQLTIVQSR